MMPYLRGSDPTKDSLIEQAEKWERAYWEFVRAMEMDRDPLVRQLQSCCEDARTVKEALTQQLASCAAGPYHYAPERPEVEGHYVTVSTTGVYGVARFCGQWFSTTEPYAWAGPIRGGATRRDRGRDVDHSLTRAALYLRASD